MRQYLARTAVGFMSLLIFGCSGDKATGPESVSTVTIQPGTLSLRAGESQTVSASLAGVKGAAITGRAVTWSVANSSVAQVSSGGEVTAIASGQTTVLATAEGRSGTMALTVLPAAVATVSLDQPTVRLYPSQTTTIKATLKDSRGNTLTDRAVGWTSLNPAVATVSGAGVVTAVAMGTATITATSEEKTATAAVSIVAVPIATLAVTPATVSLYPTNTRQLTATAKDSAGNDLTGRPVSWTTSNPAVATVSGAGFVTALAVGAATITATSEGKTATAAMVVKLVPVQSVAIARFGEGISVGESIQLYATSRDSAGITLTGRTITWKSSVSSIATVSSNGVMVGASQGTTNISACAETICASVAVSVVFDRLTAADSIAQTKNLEILSKPWTSTAEANAIFLKPQYTSRAWEAFIRAFFKDHPLTYDLRFYFVHVMMLWFDDAHQRKLQTAFINSSPSLIQGIFNRPSDLEQTLASDGDARATINNTLGFVSEIVSRNHSFADDQFNQHEQMISQYPDLFIRVTNPLTQPYVGALKRDVTTNYAIMKPLTPELKARIASTLQIVGARLDIWNKHGLLVVDNDGLNAEQLQIIDTFLTLIPKEWRPLQAITVNDFFTRTSQWRGSVTYIADRAAVNIFGFKPSDLSENQFPSDIAPRYVPVFASTLAHEINHIVDNPGILNDSYFGPRRQALLKAAGIAPLHYLRSSADAGVFFTNAPQEFFASIANQWFADSEHTIRLGRQRFDGGLSHPLNQALFFAEAYARGRQATLLYSLTTQGKLTVVEAPVERNVSGRITAIITTDSVFRFTRNASGDVVSHSASKR